MFINTPVLSLTPLNTEIADPAVYLPVINKILTNPDKIYYDPYKTFALNYPTVPVYYVEYPDLNTDASVKRKIYDSAWSKFSSDWIYGYSKIFKYFKKSGSNYKLVRSLREGEKNNAGNIDEKAAWIITNFYTKSNLATTLEKFRNRTGIDIWDVLDKEYIDNFRSFIYHQIKRKIATEVSIY